MNEEPKPGTWGAVTRSTEEEHKAFRRMLDRLMITPEKLAQYIEDELRKRRKNELPEDGS